MGMTDLRPARLIFLVSSLLMLPLAHAERLSVGNRAVPQIFSSTSKTTQDYLREAEEQMIGKNYHAAEVSARQAIEKQKLNRKARYLLGMSLAAQHRNPNEAADNLRDAAVEYPEARLELSRVLMDQGKIEEAMSELKKYLNANQLRAK